MSKSRLNLAISEETKQTLAARADALGTSQTAVIIKAVEVYGQLITAGRQGHAIVLIDAAGEEINLLIPEGQPSHGLRK